MRPPIPVLILLVASLPFGSVHAQDKPWDLVGQVFNIENGEERTVRLPRIKLTVSPYFIDGLSDGNGVFIIRMPADAKPGQEVELIHSGDKYQIFSPYKGRQRLPAPGSSPPVIEIRMLPNGSKRWLTDKFIDEFIADEQSQSAERLSGEAGGRFDFDASLRGLATYTGVNEKETREQLTGYVSKFRRDASDRHRQANAEFLAKNYSLAGDLYIKAAEGLERAGVEQIRLGAYEREAAGDAFTIAFDFARALSTYQAAEGRLAAYRATGEALGLGDYPESGFDRRRLASKGANTRLDLATRVEGAAITRLLAEAVGTYRKLRDEVPRSAELRNWATAQNNLSIALRALADRSEGPRAAELLGEARNACHSALEVLTREKMPEEWAWTQNNLGRILRDLASHSEVSRSAELLEQATDAYHSALEVLTREKMPRLWASAQNNLGNVLSYRSIGLEGRRATELLEQAIDAFHSALEVYIRESPLQLRAVTQSNLANAQSRLADRVEGPRSVELLEQAIDAYCSALEVYTREGEGLSQLRATAQNNLANARSRLAVRVEGPRSVELLDEAINACHSALQVRTRGRLPMDWAATQNTLGDAQSYLAIRVDAPRSVELLDEAITTYRSALEVYTRKELPRKWAMTQDNLGNAFRELAIRSEGPRAAKLLGEAIDACRSALQVNTREVLPEKWARTRSELGITLGAFLATDNFRAGLEQFSRLMAEKPLAEDPQFVALVDVLRVMCHRALGEEARATESLDALIAHIGRQPEGFGLPWSFSWLRHVVEHSGVEAVAARREYLLGVLNAASGDSRDAILQGLKRLRK